MKFTVLTILTIVAFLLSSGLAAQKGSVKQKKAATTKACCQETPSKAKTPCCQLGKTVTGKVSREVVKTASKTVCCQTAKPATKTPSKGGAECCVAKCCVVKCCGTKCCVVKCCGTKCCVVKCCSTGCCDQAESSGKGEAAGSTKTKGKECRPAGCADPKAKSKPAAKKIVVI